MAFALARDVHGPTPTSVASSPASYPRDPAMPATRTHCCFLPLTTTIASLLLPPGVLCVLFVSDHQDRQDPDSERRVHLQTRRTWMHQVLEETRFSSSSTTVARTRSASPKTQVPRRRVRMKTPRPFRDSPKTATDDSNIYGNSCNYERERLPSTSSYSDSSSSSSKHVPLPLR